MTWVEELNKDPEERRLVDRERTLLEATEAICEAMQQQGVTRNELRKRLDLTPQQLHNLLDGKAGMRLRELSDAAYALGCRVRIKLERDSDGRDDGGAGAGGQGP